MNLEYAKTTPRQLTDGRFFVKVANKVIIQLNNSTLCESYESSEDDITLSVSDQYSGQLADIDAQTIAAAKTNSVEWFKRELTEKTIASAYTKSTMTNVEKMKSTVIYDHKKMIVEDKNIPAGTVCDVLVELSGVWFLKKTFGLVWRVVQVRLKSPPKNKLKQEVVYMFQGDDADSDSDSDEYK